MLERVRQSFAYVEGEPTPFFGLSAALAIALPLIVGALTGHAGPGSVISLGAYLVAQRAPEGPYGARARDLGSAVLIVALGATVGGLLSGHTWIAVAAVPPIVAIGSAVNWIGSTAGMAVLMTAIRPHPHDLVSMGTLELLGGLLFCVLVLAPWPARRLRPLQEALADAADEVAGALDAVAQEIGGQDPAALNAVHITNPDLAEVVHTVDWDAQRRAAAEALTEARETYAQYRTARSKVEPTRPERLIDALSRILHETVALRALVEAERRRPPDRNREWELEAHVAIAALASRLRLLSGAIRTAGESPLGAPLGDMDSAAIRRLARQSDKIRRAGLAGDEDLVAVALISQIRRAIDRIAGGVDSARRLVKGGLRLGVGPPKLPTPHPMSTWERVVRAVRTRSPTFRLAMRVYVTAVVAMSISAAFDMPHGQWMVITAMLSLRGTYGETIDRILERIGGTAVGSVIAAVLLALAPGQIAAALILFVFAVAGFTMRPVNITYWFLFGTPLAMMTLDFSTPSDWTAAGERIVLTLLGGALALLAIRLLWPAGHVERLPGQLRRLLTAHAELVRVAAEVVQGEREQLPYEMIVSAERSAETVAEARTSLGHERVPDDLRAQDLGQAVDSAHRLRDHLITIARMTREDESVDSGPVPEILDRVADLLEEAAEVLSEPVSSLGAAEGPSVEDRLEEEFADLDEHLSSIARSRRDEVEGGVDHDEYTPLRHALLQVSGTRYALRSLRRDTDMLISGSLKAALQDVPPPEIPEPPRAPKDIPYTPINLPPPPL
ncbi:FUSC family protein [Actinomadura rupiterrae]|uniref:FUSC family protein n=1 Tax=Actinomadura rupiterrae TaxID=559627 RepID=UPI0020A269CA|nr:FUSC family protein [Actinomadura rupiterrae]MCP2340345.1 putative membrane protein YccC [Actinomadura rupiterrae]